MNYESLLNRLQGQGRKGMTSESLLKRLREKKDIPKVPPVTPTVSMAPWKREPKERISRHPRDTRFAPWKREKETAKISKYRGELEFREVETNDRNFFQKIKEEYRRGDKGQKNDLEMFKVVASPDGKDYEKVNKERLELYRQDLLDPIGYENIGGKTVGQVSRMLPGMATGGIKGIVGRLAGTVGFAGLGMAAGQITPGMPIDDAAFAVMGGRIGYFIGGSKYWYKQGTGSMYAELREQGVNHDLAQGVAAVSGMPYALIEYSQVDRLIPGLEQLAKKSLLSASKKAIEKAVKKYGKNWVNNVTQEGIQEMIAGISTEVGMALDESVQGNENKQMLVNVFTRGLEGLSSSALPMLLLGSGQTVADVTGEVRTAKKIIKERDEWIKKPTIGLTIDAEEQLQLFEPEVKVEEVGVEPLTAEVEVEPMVTEARKYKTAEEFVDSQTKLFHGTQAKFKDEDIALRKIFNIKEDGIFFTSSQKEAAVSGDVKTFALKSDTKLKEIDVVFTKTNEKALDIEIEKAIDNGFDAVRFKSISSVSGEETFHTILFNKDKLLTKSQLTDIFNKSQKAEPGIVKPIKIKGTTDALTDTQLKRWNEIKNRTPGYKYKKSDWDIHEIVNFKEEGSGGKIDLEARTMGEFEITKNIPPKQLVDYYKKLEAKPTVIKKRVKKEVAEPLLTEARKYKTAEEFVKSQDKTVQNFLEAKEKALKVEGTSVWESTELMPIDEALRFAEFDRRVTPKFGGIDKLKADIAKNGIKEPLILSYGVDTKNAIIGEGNHRLIIAKELGIKDVPVYAYRVSELKGYKAGDMFGELSNKPVPVRGYIKEGHIPTPLKPSDIGVRVSNLQTKSQLTDIWNKAQKAEPIEKPIGDILEVGRTEEEILYIQQIKKWKEEGKSEEFFRKEYEKEFDAEIAVDEAPTFSKSDLLEKEWTGGKIDIDERVELKREEQVAKPWRKRVIRDSAMVKELIAHLKRLGLKGVDIKFVKAIWNDKKGKIIFGQYFDGKITLAEVLSKFTHTHELGHLVFEHMEDIPLFKGISKNAIYRELRVKHPELKTKRELNEALQRRGEELAYQYKKRGKVIFNKTKVDTFWKRIFESLKRIFNVSKEGQIDKFWETLLTKEAKEITVIKKRGVKAATADDYKVFYDYDTIDQIPEQDLDWFRNKEMEIAFAQEEGEHFGSENLEEQYEDFKKLRIPTKTLLRLEDLDTFKDTARYKNYVQKIGMEPGFFYSQELTGDEVWQMFRDRIVREREGPLTKEDKIKYREIKKLLKIQEKALKNYPEVLDKLDEINVTEASRDKLEDSQVPPELVSKISKAVEPEIKYEKKVEENTKQLFTPALFGETPSKIKNKEALLKEAEKFPKVEEFIEKKTKPKPQKLIQERKYKPLSKTQLANIWYEAKGMPLINSKILNHIKQNSDIEKLKPEWIRKSSFKYTKKKMIKAIQGYETGARFFKRLGKGFKEIVFDPIRLAQRTAAQRATNEINELREVFFDRNALSKEEIKSIFFYSLYKQGKMTENEYYNETGVKPTKKGPVLKDLSKAAQKAYYALRKLTERYYPEVKKVGKLNNKVVKKVKHYLPLYTDKDMRELEAGGLTGWTRYDPFFGSVEERKVEVPWTEYDKDLRKVMENWIHGVTNYVEVGSRTIPIGALITSPQFKELSGDAQTPIINWYKNITQPDVPSGWARFFKFWRTIRGYTILAYKYGVILKQFLNLLDFTVVTGGKHVVKASVQRGKDVFRKDKGYARPLKDLGKQIDLGEKSLITVLANKAGSVNERTLGFEIDDIKTMMMNWGSKPALYTDKLTAKIGYMAVLEQQMDRARKEGKGLTNKEFKRMQRRADDIVDAVMGGMAKAEQPAYFRTETGKQVNMFYSQLNSKMQFYVTDIWKDELVNVEQKKVMLLSRALISVILIGYIEEVINRLEFFGDEEDEKVFKEIIKNIAGNFPLIGSMVYSVETGKPFMPSPLYSSFAAMWVNAAKGKKEDAIWDGTGFIYMPDVVQNVLRGIKIIREGGVYDKSGRLMYPVEGTMEQIRTLLKGKWGSKAAQDYWEARKPKPKTKADKEKAKKLKEKLKRKEKRKKKRDAKKKVTTRSKRKQQVEKLKRKEKRKKKREANRK